MKLVSSESKGHYGVHRLSLESIEEQESDSVVLYHFWEWPRHATPNTGIEGICEMIQEVMRAKSNEQLDTVRKKFAHFCCQGNICDDVTEASFSVIPKASTYMYLVEDLGLSIERKCQFLWFQY